MARSYQRRSRHLLRKLTETCHSFAILLFGSHCWTSVGYICLNAWLDPHKMSAENGKATELAASTEWLHSMAAMTVMSCAQRMRYLHVQQHQRNSVGFTHLSRELGVLGENAGRFWCISQYIATMAHAPTKKVSAMSSDVTSSDRPSGAASSCACTSGNRRSLSEGRSREQESFRAVLSWSSVTPERDRRNRKHQRADCL